VYARRPGIALSTEYPKGTPIPLRRGPSTPERVLRFSGKRLLGGGGGSGVAYYEVGLCWGPKGEYGESTW